MSGGAPAARPAFLRGLEGLAGALSRAWSRATLPRFGAVRVPGLAATTTIRFDDHGVPHVRAETEADAFRAIGVCHARDRYFQMDMTRRVLSGRLSEVVGERPLGVRGLPPLTKKTTLDADRLMRALDLVRAAKATVAAGSADERHLLGAYVDGVNATVRRLRRNRSPEWRLLRHPLEPWTVEDSCLLAKGMALGLSFKWRTGPVFAAVAAALGDREDLLRAILPRSPNANDSSVARVSPGARGLEAALSFLGWDAPQAGSNAFVVGGGRSASGMPILASDPHLELSLPGVWYLASLSGGPYAAVGATFPGMPGVVIGRTPTVAWGVTNGMIDDTDLYYEEIDGTGTRYRLDGRWTDLDVVTQEIARRGGAPTLFRLRRTHRGPILSDAFPGYEGKPFSMRATFHEGGREMQTFLHLGRARTAADVEAATAGYGSPAQNLVYATTEGIAGYRLMGHVPLRPPGEPALPFDGTTSASDWKGFVPAEELPAFRIPPDGQVVTANDPIVGPPYPHYLSNLFEPPYRAGRIRERLGRRTGLTVDDLAAIQLDATSLGMIAFRRAVLLPLADAARAARPRAAPLLDKLLSATGSEEVDAPFAPLFHLTYYHLALEAFGRVLGEPLAKRYMALTNLMDAALLRAFSDPEGAGDEWVKPATRPNALAEAVEAAAKDLGERGLSPDARWGEIHRLTLRHPLGSAPILGAAWNRGPYPMPGGPFTPRSGLYVHDRPADMVTGASYRHVVDLGHPERASRMITFGGQSGHLGSPHYDDLTPLWMRGAFLPMRLGTWPERGVDLTLVQG